MLSRKKIISVTQYHSSRPRPLSLSSFCVFALKTWVFTELRAAERIIITGVGSGEKNLMFLFHLAFHPLFSI